ncbi:uncharacterized protein FA14DRAFT_50814 [Meira miltonrushii]|uniref:Uncharacterized protein n=1 Tax=Meira miltonrushii TaxID=1280837 RepID=A0A316VEQ3_9BASI|nr:uncharacterized protein FA14DRAFT_50814 [Meira miltonrushii]PWN36006.1 hypothetical protein FA14DRAFT_50814 [Meira miltonrushii]
MKPFTTSIGIAILLLLGTFAHAAPMPSPVQRRAPANGVVGSSAQPTPQPRGLASDASANEVFEFYKPVARLAEGRDVNAREEGLNYAAMGAREAMKRKLMAEAELSPSPVERSDTPSVPLSQLGPPSFPAQYPSCYNCQQKYSSLSSCMEAASVFQNATSIFNSPLSYIAVIKCACTDTFQAVYPQCVQCFQMTDQCYYLGTDPKGTGAPEIVTNIRQICAFGSSLLGGAEKANYPYSNNTFTPSVVPAYTDVTQGGAGYEDQATGAIFGGAMQVSAPAVLPFLLMTSFACLVALVFI